MKTRVNYRAGLSVGTLLCLVAAASLAPLGGASPVPMVGTGHGAPEVWAYGSEQWVNDTILSSAYTYTSSAFYGSQVVTTATNTSASTVMVEGAWTWTYSYVEHYCVPNCTHGPTNYNVTITEWGTEYSFLNTTSVASVHTHHGSTAAYGISNVSYQVASNYSEVYLYIYNGSLLYKGSAYNAAQSGSTFQFKPALGLIPWNLTKNETWSSASALASASTATSDYHYYFFGYGENSLSVGNALSKWTLASNETVNGRDDGNTTLVNGQNGTAISLAFTGIFNVYGGLFFAPVSSDAFGGATQNWSVGVLYGTIASTPVLIVGHLTNGPSYSILGSSTSWSSSVRAVGVPSQLPTSVGPSNAQSPPSGTVVSQPEQVAYAKTIASCYVGHCIGAVSAPGPSSSVPFPAWAMAVAAGAGAALVIAARFRPRRPASAGTLAAPAAPQPPA